MVDEIRTLQLRIEQLRQENDALREDLCEMQNKQLALTMLHAYDVRAGFAREKKLGERVAELEKKAHETMR